MDLILGYNWLDMMPLAIASVACITAIVKQPNLYSAVEGYPSGFV
jgi:hypothetical protein